MGQYKINKNVPFFWYWKNLMKNFNIFLEQNVIYSTFLSGIVLSLTFDQKTDQIANYQKISNFNDFTAGNTG